MRTITFLLIAFFTVNSYGQLKVVKNQPSVEIGKVTNLNDLVIKCEKTGDMYTFTYQDEKFKHLTNYKTFSVQGQKDFESLYKIIMKNMKEQPDEPVMLELDEGYLFLKYGKTFGSPYVNIGHVLDKNANVIGFTQWLNKRKVRKLFGK